MEEPHALVERRGHVLIVTMNRPQARNALSAEMMAIMRTPGTRSTTTRRSGLRSDRGGRRVLRGRRPAGDDPDRTPATGSTATGPVSVIDALLKGRRLTKPLIAAVEGPAVAGGTEILQATDVRVAAGERAVRRLRGALGAVPAGRFGGAAAPPDPVHGRGRAAAHRAAHQRGRGAVDRADRPRGAGRAGPGQGAGDRRGDRGQRAGRGAGHPADHPGDRGHGRGGLLGRRCPRRRRRVLVGGRSAAQSTAAPGPVRRAGPS